MKKGRDSKLSSRNPLTREEAGRLAEAVAQGLDYAGADLSRLMLLIHALAYEPDATARENMLVEAELRLAVYLPGVDEATDTAKRVELDALRGGAR
jgi:hypothetical protein